MPTHHLVSSHTPQQTLPRSLVLSVISRRFTSSLACGALAQQCFTFSLIVWLHFLFLSFSLFLSLSLSPSLPLSLPLSLSLSLSLSQSLTRTHTYAEKTFFPPDCFPIFLAERFMVRGMLETGYYHVLFELISQTKWSRWKRRHLGGGGAFTATHSSYAASPLLSPMVTLLRLPIPPCFHQRQSHCAASVFPPIPFDCRLDVKQHLPCWQMLLGRQQDFKHFNKL